MRWRIEVWDFSLTIKDLKERAYDKEKEEVDASH